MSLLYFAYGSNLWLPRLRHRVPGVEALGAAALHGFSLRWHKRSHDGSGKASIVEDPGGVVHGGLFRVPRGERAGLDRVEELGTGYGDAEVQLDAGGRRVRAYTYVALPAVRDDALRPYDWYRDFVSAGAEWLGLPGDYVDALRRVAAHPDPDPERVRRQRAFLARPPGPRPPGPGPVDEPGDEVSPPNRTRGDDPRAGADP